MAFDRESTLKKAEKLLRQGRLDAAIAEYVRVVEDQPRDWNTANTLGDLYGRAGQTEKAVAQYAYIADHFLREGFYPKAAALYKKILKIHPEDEDVQLRLADISARQGLLADAKSHLNAVAARRRKRGDEKGAAEIVVRLGSIDPADFDARQLAARTLELAGDREGAADRFKALADDLSEKGRGAEALEALRAYARLRPDDRAARAGLARAALEAGDFEQAREHLTSDTAVDDPALLLSLVELEVRSGSLERARDLLPGVLGAMPGLRERVAGLGWTLIEGDPQAAFLCVDCAVNAAMAVSDYAEAAGTLQEFVRRVPGQIPALLKLVEVCVDGGLESAMYEAQELLTDAYLAAGQASEARVIAEDLVAREPWERAHIERFRRALVMLRVSEPDTVIAERLSGQAPFMATDPFFDLSDVQASAQPADDMAPGDAVWVEEVPKARVDDLLPSAVPESEPSTAPQPFAESPAAPQAFDEIDLTGALGNLQPADAPAPSEGPRDLEQVFEKMREDAEQNVPDYSTQHMTLARTYLEIGMVEEAVSSLKTAVRSLRHRFEAASILGRLYMQRSDVPHAIEWFERAAEAPAPDADAGRALLYDLGVMLDTAGETERALAVLLELQADAGDYRDVPSRIDRLARAQSGG